MAAYATDAPKFRLLESVVLDRPSCKLLVIDGMEDSIFPIEDNFIVGVKGDKKIWLSEVTGLTWAIPGRRSSCTDGSMTRWRGNLEVIEQGSTDFAEEIARKIFDEWRNGRLTELRFCVIAVSTSIQLLIVDVWPQALPLLFPPRLRSISASEIPSPRREIKSQLHLLNRTLGLVVSPVSEG